MHFGLPVRVQFGPSLETVLTTRERHLSMLKPFGNTFEVRFGPYKIVAAYLVLGLLWILASDAVLAWIIQDAGTLSALQSAKGFAFVLFTAAALFWLVRRDVRVIEEGERDLAAAYADLEELAAFPRLSPNPILRLRADGEVEYANRATGEALRSLGLTDASALLPGDIEATIADVLRSGVPAGDVDVPVGGTSFRWELFPDQSRQHVYAYGSDRTRELALQGKLAQAEKLDTLGRLAAGVAHDFNNLLTGIRSYTSLLGDELEGQETYRDDVRQIEAAVDRAAMLIRRLTRLGGDDEPGTGTSDVNREVSEMAPLLRHLLPRTATLELDLAKELPEVDIDPVELGRVLCNLVVNAGDALGESGSVTVRTRPGDGRGSVSLSVRDNGRGMSADTIARVWEPYFTTKATGRGTGLGLPTVRAIVERRGGQISVESEPGQGTEFTIQLPRVEQAEYRAS